MIRNDGSGGKRWIFTVLKIFSGGGPNGQHDQNGQRIIYYAPNLSKHVAHWRKKSVCRCLNTERQNRAHDYARMFLSSVDIAFAELKRPGWKMSKEHTLNQNIYHWEAISSLSGCSFSEAHPEIGIRRLDFTTLELVQNLLDEIINYALSNEMIEDERIDFQLIDSNPYVFVMHKNHPLAECGKLSMGQLKEATFIC